MAFEKKIVSTSFSSESFEHTMEKLGSAVKDFSPVTKTIKNVFLQTMSRRAWTGSGLHSRSGELKGAITPFSGKKSFGVGLRTMRGRDLVLAKAATHSFGRKKGSNKQGYSRQRVAEGTVGPGVYRKVSRGKGKGKLFRRVRLKPSPWGDIPARPFMPTEMPQQFKDRSKKLIVEFINEQLA